MARVNFILVTHTTGIWTRNSILLRKVPVSILTHKSEISCKPSDKKKMIYDVLDSVPWIIQYDFNWAWQMERCCHSSYFLLCRWNLWLKWKEETCPWDPEKWSLESVECIIQGRFPNRKFFLYYFGEVTYLESFLLHAKAALGHQLGCTERVKNGVISPHSPLG